MSELQPADPKPRQLSPSLITDAEAEAMFRAAVNLFDKWGLTHDQASAPIDLPTRTYRRWMAGAIGRIGHDRRARLSNLMGIHGALRIIFRDAQRGYDWIR